MSYILQSKSESFPSHDSYGHLDVARERACIVWFFLVIDMCWSRLTGILPFQSRRYRDTVHRGGLSKNADEEMKTCIEASRAHPARAHTQWESHAATPTDLLSRQNLSRIFGLGLLYVIQATGMCLVESSTQWRRGSERSRAVCAHEAMSTQKRQGAENQKIWTLSWVTLAGREAQTCVQATRSYRLELGLLTLFLCFTSLKEPERG